MEITIIRHQPMEAENQRVPGTPDREAERKPILECNEPHLKDKSANYENEGYHPDGNLHAERGDMSTIHAGDKERVEELNTMAMQKR